LTDIHLPREEAEMLEFGFQHNVEKSTRSCLGDPVHGYENCHKQLGREQPKFFQTSDAQEKSTAIPFQVAQLYYTNINDKVVC
jgi:hypothetical protein